MSSNAYYCLGFASEAFCIINILKYTLYLEDLLEKPLHAHTSQSSMYNHTIEVDCRDILNTPKYYS